MGYKLIAAKDAQLDIDEITGYIAHVLKNPQAASGFLSDVEKSYRSLMENPRLFALCDDVRLRRKGYRKVIIKNYLITYRIEDQKRTVFVVRVI